MATFDDQFAALRSLMNEPMNAQNKAGWLERLITLVCPVYAQSPEVYQELWVPYMQGFAKCWEAPLFITNLDHAGALSFAKPILKVNNCTLKKIKAKLIDAPALNNLSGIDLSQNRLSLNHVKALAKSPYLKQMDALNLEECAVKDKGVEVLADALGPLTRLRISECGLTAQSMEVLLKHPNFSQLSHLSLGLNPSISRSQQLLDYFQSERAKRLTHLELNGLKLPLKSLQALRQLSHLKHLGLQGAPLVRGGLKHVGNIQTLTHLNLTRAQFNPAEIKTLAGKAQLPNLQSLNLALTLYDDPKLGLLSKACWLEHLQALYLDNNWIEDQHLINLLQHQSLKNIDRLALDYNRISDVGFAILVGKCTPRHLSLRQNRLGPKAMKALANSNCLYRTHTLTLTQNRIQGEGLNALLHASHFEALDTLELTSIGISASELQQLATSPQLHTLSSLDLSYNPSSPKAIFDLVQSPHLQNLHTLSFQGMKLADEHVDALCDGFALPNLHTLSLSNNFITPRGAMRLAACQKLNTLSTLELENNNIGSLGTKAANALANSPFLAKSIREQWLKPSKKQKD